MYYIFNVYDAGAYALFSSKGKADEFVEKFKHWMEKEWGEADETCFSLIPIPSDNPDFDEWIRIT